MLAGSLTASFPSLIIAVRDAEKLSTLSQIVISGNQLSSSTALVPHRPLRLLGEQQLKLGKVSRTSAVAEARYHFKEVQQTRSATPPKVELCESELRLSEERCREREEFR
jgi:hypothetical protein